MRIDLRNIKYLFSSLLIALVMGCVDNTRPTPQLVSMDTYVGKPASAIIKVFGDDYTTLELGEGMKTLSWLRHDIVMISQHKRSRSGQTTASSKGGVVSTSKSSRLIMPKTAQYPCEIRFNVNKTNTITGWHSQGPGCKTILESPNLWHK